MASGPAGSAPARAADRDPDRRAGAAKAALPDPPALLIVLFGIVATLLGVAGAALRRRFAAAPAI